MDDCVLVKAKRSSGKVMAGLILLGGLALSGCTTVNRMQCQLLPAEKQGSRAVISDADRETVREILRARATELRLVERTDISLVPQTVVFFTDIDVENPIKLIAWERDGKILIDFMQGMEGVGEPLQFRAARERLYGDLQEQFPGRIKIVPIGKMQTAGETIQR